MLEYFDKEYLTHYMTVFLATRQGWQVL